VTLRLRLTLVAAGVVAIVVAAASITVYFSMRHGLRAQIDGDLTTHARAIQENPRNGFRSFGDFTNDAVQIVDRSGTSVGGNTRLLPVDAAVRSVGTGERDAFYRDVVIRGYHVREVVAPLPDPLGAVIVARSLDDVDLAQGYPSFIKLAGTTDPNSALLFDGTENKNFAIQWVVRPESANDPRIRKFIAIYQHSPAVRRALDNAFGSLYAIAW